MGSVDGTNISSNHLAYRWKVEMKKRENIKEEGGNEIGGSKKGEKKERNKKEFQNQTCNRTCE